MAANTDPIFTKEAAWGAGTTFQNADGTATKDIYTAGPDGSLVTAIIVSTTEMVANTLQFFLNNGGIDQPLGTAVIPADAGTNGTTLPVSVLTDSNWSWPQNDPFGNRVFKMEPLAILKAKVLSTAVTAPETLTVVVAAENF